MKILAEMVNNKPSLSKYVSEKDNEEEIDYSILSIYMNSVKEEVLCRWP